MTISSFQAAKKICELSDWTITNLKLQKILYLSHLYYLGREKEPLVNEKFEAWYYGPVEPLLYDKMKVFGNRPIRDAFFDITTKTPCKEFYFIENQYNEISNKSTWDLVLLTHLKGGAWERYFEEDQKHRKIPNEDISEEYNKFYGK